MNGVITNARQDMTGIGDLTSAMLLGAVVNETGIILIQAPVPIT
jgi:pyridoxal/pyridoxine/pyridoxamine kinase